MTDSLLMVCPPSDFIAHRAAEDVARKGIGSGDGRYAIYYCRKRIILFSHKTDILIARY